MSRAIYYQISLGIGIFYVAFYFTARILLENSGWIGVIDTIFLVFNIAIIAVFYVKDTLDEFKIKKGYKPAGPSWFEHSSFVLVVGIVVILSATYDVDPFMVTLKLVLFFLALGDFFWDLWQDSRSRNYR